MKHYVLLHRRPTTPTAIKGVYHEPSAPISLARSSAACLCRNMEVYEEHVADAGDYFRVVYGTAGECFALVEAPPRIEKAPDHSANDKRTPLEWRRWFFGLIEPQLDGEWELVDALLERDIVTVQNPGSPFLGKTPGENIFYSLHLRLNETARALLRVTAADRARVKATLEDDGE
jgi:hypothetical protein